MSGSPQYIAIAFLCLLGVSCSRPHNGTGKAEKGSGQVPQEYLEAARTALGPGAVVLRVAHPDGTDSTEVLAALSLASIPPSQGCTPVSHIVVLRRSTEGWQTVLDADKDGQVKNPEGYVGVDYIDDSQENRSPGYCADLSQELDKHFSLALTYLTAAGAEDGIPVYVEWNDKVGRYQSSIINSDPPGFESELKNPPHVDTSKRRCCTHDK